MRRGLSVTHSEERVILREGVSKLLETVVFLQTIVTISQSPRVVSLGIVVSSTSPGLEQKALT